MKRPLSSIVLTVFAVHAALLLSSLISYRFRPLSKKRMHIQTVSPLPSITASPLIAKKEPPFSPPVASHSESKLTPSKQKTAPAPPRSRSPRKTPPSPKRREKPSPSDQLVQEMQTHFEAATKNPSSNPSIPPRSSLAIPTLQLSLSAEMTPSAGISPGGETLQTIQALLQQALELPEFGEVKVELRLSRKGHLEQIRIVETKSEKNAQFLKNQLPLLSFPCLNDPLSFVVVFRNE